MIIKADIISEDFPTHFQRQGLDLINSLLPLDSSGFYLVDPDMHHRGMVLRNMDSDSERQYFDKFAVLDPLYPPRYANSTELVVCIDEQVTEEELLVSTYYREFMLPRNHRHVSDMFFRHGGNIIAVLTMLRGPELGPFQQAELDLVRRLQPFLEYALNNVYLPRRYRQRATVQSKYKLTDRELDVLELIVAGASNKVIARELSVGLPTVKTHVQHIFLKADVTSRTVLSARVLGDIGD